MQMQKITPPVAKNGTTGSESKSGAGASPPAPGPALEVAHVLFMDVIGYSKLRMNQQAAIVIELQELVQRSAEVIKARAEGKLIVRPTGDGMALLFLRDLLSPVRCALEIQVLLSKEAQAIKARVGGTVALRMGIHSGSVLLVEDLNAQSEVAGEGINMAQRVMDCGDAGHILLSSDIADRLIKIDPWSRYLKDLGVCHVKHGVGVHLFNLSGRFEGVPCGNSGTPRKVADDQAALAQAERERRATFFEKHPAARGWFVATAVLLLVGGGGWGLYSKVPAVQQSVNRVFQGSPKVTPPAKGAKTPKGTKAPAKTSEKTPPSGSTVASSGSAALVQVPDLSGQTFGDAKQTGTADGLRVRRSSKSNYNSQFAQGTIYQQSPAAGAMAARDTVIYVRISKGDSPDPTEKIQESDDKPAPETPTESSSEGTGGE